MRQPLKDKQLIDMSNASFTAAGYANMIEMIEDNPNQKLQTKRKTYARNELRNDIQTKAKEVNIYLSGIDPEEQIYILPDPDDQFD